MSVRIAELGEVRVLGGTEIRVLENPSLSNTSGYPTLKQYLTLEAADGYMIKHLDQTSVVTYSSVSDDEMDDQIDPDTDFVAAVSDVNPTHWWRLNESVVTHGSIAEAQIGDIDGLIQGADMAVTTGLISGSSNGAYLFNGDGTSNRIELTGITTDPSQFTVAMLVRPETANALSGTQILYGHRTSSTELIQLRIDDGVPWFQIRDSTNDLATIQQEASMVAGQSYFLVGVMDRENNSHKLYVFDGDDVAVQTDTSVISGTVSATNQTIGGVFTGSDYSFFVDDMIIDEVLIWADVEPPTQAQLQTIHDVARGVL